jgi:hypothetical protein
MDKNAAMQIISGTEYKSRKWGPFGEQSFFKAVIQRALCPIPYTLDINLGTKTRQKVIVCRLLLSSSL